MAQTWDIFCRIVDNYGDIGVTWRLARQLAAEHGKSVRLWIDDLATARKLIPALNVELPSQKIDGVEICPWENAQTAIPANVIIEAFACEVPPAYLRKMADSKPLWVNLEYLSAESWVPDFHLRKSQHPILPLTKYFFFPGFEPHTGGLIREQNLIAHRDDFQHSHHAQEAFRHRLGIPANEALTVSLFCYPHAPLADLLETFSHAPHLILCLVPESGIWPVIGEVFSSELKAGNSLRKGNLTLLPLPFLSQDDYDRLLWLSDINFVRGEDSWVRAVWAGKPLVWQPYHQEESTHLAKLAAFLNAYGEGLETEAIAAMHECHAAWCGTAFPEAIWREYLNSLPLLHPHAMAFATQLAATSDLASKLVIFCGNSS